MVSYVRGGTTGHHSGGIVFADCLLLFNDGNTYFILQIFEGEHPVARKNHHVGYFNFVIPRHLRGQSSENGEQLPVTFALNAAGTLQV